MTNDLDRITKIALSTGASGCCLECERLSIENAELKVDCSGLQAAYNAAFKRAWGNGDALRIERLKNAELERVIAESKEQPYLGEVAWNGHSVMLYVHNREEMRKLPAGKYKLYAAPVIREGMVAVGEMIEDCNILRSTQKDGSFIDIPVGTKLYAKIEASKGE